MGEQTLKDLAARHGKQVSTHLYGQEINAETYAIAKADLLLQGEGDAPLEVCADFWHAPPMPVGFDASAPAIAKASIPSGIWRMYMSARKQVSAGVVVGFAMTLLSTSATAQVVYDLGDFPFVFSGPVPATEVNATLQTSTTGIFTTEAAIENFLNLATYSVVLKNGPTTILTLNNANSAWDMVFEGTGATATLTATPSKITLDFSTPNEISSAALVLGVPPGVAQYRQGNNVTDFNFVNIDDGAESTADATVPYDAPFIFPAISVPVSSAPALSLSALGLLAGLLSGLGILTIRRRSRV